MSDKKREPMIDTAMVYEAMPAVPAEVAPASPEDEKSETPREMKQKERCEVRLVLVEIAKTREKSLRTQAEINLLTEQTREALQRLKAA